MKHAMRPQAQKAFHQELEEAERFGTLAVKETCAIAIDKVQYWEQLSAMGVSLLQAAESALQRNDKEMTCTYFFLYDELCEYAKENLKPEGYHLFCEQQMKYEPYLYL